MPYPEYTQEYICAKCGEIIEVGVLNHNSQFKCDKCGAVYTVRFEADSGTVEGPVDPRHLC